jgi:dipeptidyl aminopeptidase/acylaminoacyl peptidase
MRLILAARFIALVFVPVASAVLSGQAPTRRTLSDSSGEAFARMVFAYSRPVVEISANAVSPDGRWIAYSAAAQLGEAIASDNTQLVAAHNTLYLASLADLKAPRVRVGPQNAATWDPVWSRDGQSLAFNLLVDGTIRVGIHDIRAGTSRVLSTEPIAKGFNYTSPPAWSADGRSLFLVVSRAKPAPGTVVTRDSIRARLGSSASTFLSGSDRTLRPKEQQNDNPGMYSREGVTTAIVRFEVATGKSETLVSASGQAAPWNIYLSPSGRWIAYTSNSRNNVWRYPDGVPDSLPHVPLTLNIIPAAGGSPALTVPSFELDAIWWSPVEDRIAYQVGSGIRVSDLRGSSGANVPTVRLAPNAGYIGHAVAFTRDGKGMILGGESERANSTFYPRSVWLADLDGTPARKLEVPDRYRFQRLLQVAGDAVWQPHADSITAMFDDHVSDSMTVLRIPLMGGSPRVVFRGIATLRSVASTANHARLIASFETLWDAPELISFDSELKRTGNVTTLNPGIVIGRRGTARYFHTRIRRYDGTTPTIRAALILPPGASKSSPVPTVVMQYPGDLMSEDAGRFPGPGAYFPALILLNEGYGVLLADFPVRPPDGTVGNRVVEAADLLLPQIYNAVATDSAVDLRRLALYGQSQGGMMSAMLATHTGIFSAILNTAGMIFDYPGFYGFMRLDAPGPQSGVMTQANLGKNPYVDFLRYVTTSPYYQAYKITTPMFFAYGTGDGVDFEMEAGKMYNALLANNVAGELVRYDGEGHVLWHGNLANAVDLYYRFTNFLRRHVREK